MTVPEQNTAATEVSGLARWLRTWERSPKTPGFVVNFINWLRQNSDVERRFLREPLRSVPEFARRITRRDTLRYGNEVRTNQAIADALLFGVEYISGAAVEGELAEFGTMTGRTATVLSAALASFRHKSELHLFDGFEGLPESTNDVDKKSFHVQGGVWGEGTCQGVGPSALRAKCRRFLPDERIVIHAGWFNETVKAVPAGKKFALVHVDCDLYQSTLEALDPLFARHMISEGAVFFFDDWNCNRSRRDMGERRAWRDLCEKYSIDFSDGGDYSWGGHKIIVHTYKPTTSS
jgi:hypothetical protein